MDEVVIRLSVDSDEAVAGTDAETAALKRLEAQAGKTGDANSKSAKQEARDRKTAQKAIEDYGKAADAVYKKQASADRDRSKSTQQLIGELQKQRDETLRQAGYTTQSLAKEEDKRTANAQKAWAKRAADQVKYLKQMESDRAKSDARIEAQDKAAAKRGDDLATRVTAFRDNLYREMYDDRLKRAQAADDAEERLQSQAQQRGMRFAAMHRAAGKEDEAFDIARASAAKTRADEEEALLRRRTGNWQRFRNDLARAFGGRGGAGGGGGLVTARGEFDDGRRDGIRRGQFSKNPFIDLGGRGLQPRTIGIGSLVGLGAAAAGPVGLAAGGLLGAVPGAVAGIGASIAAFKASGLGSVAADAAKIQSIQNNIAAGVVKEAKGRAQIAAVLKGMTPEQEKALKLWDAFHKITTDIGNKVSDKMLPAFGALGKALGANAPAITTSIVTAGKAWAGLITQMSGFIGGGAGKVLFSGTLGAGNTFITSLTKQLGSLSELFLAVGSASQKFMHQISTMSAHVTTDLAKWSTSRKGQQDLKTFFKGAADEIPRVLGLVKDLGAVLVTIFKAALPFADRFLDAVRQNLQEFNKFLQSARGQQDMSHIFKDIQTAVEAVVQAISAAWPVISKVFTSIETGVKALSSVFGSSAVAIGASVLLASGKLGLLSAGIKGLSQTLLKKLPNSAGPWGAVIVGVGLAILAISNLKTNLDQLKQHARDAATDIAGVFQAIRDKGATRLDMNTLTKLQPIQAASVRSAGNRLNQDLAKGQKEGFTPGLRARVAQDQLDLARARQAWNQTTNAILADQDKLDKDGKDKAAGIKKTAADIAKALADAYKDNTVKTGNQFRGAGRFTGGDVTRQIINSSAAIKEFSKYFKLAGDNADTFKSRTQLAVAEFQAYVDKFKKPVPPKKVAAILQDLATKPIDQIILLLAAIRPKKVPIYTTGVSQTMMDIQRVNAAVIQPKTFTIVGQYKIPQSPLNPTAVPLGPKPAGGGLIPGVGGHDTVPAMLRPGEVVLNRAQQYDFGGPEVFKNYFGSKTPGLGYAGGGVVRGVGEGQIGNVIAKDVAAKTGQPVNTVTPGGSGAAPIISANAEPGWDSVVNTLRNQAPAIKQWTKKLASDNNFYLIYRDQILSPLRAQQGQLQEQYDKLRNVKGKSATDKRKVITLKQDALTARITKAVNRKRMYSDAATADRSHLRVAKKVFSHIPGYEAFQGAESAYEAQAGAYEYAAALLKPLDPAADPNAPNGINFLTQTWKNLNNLYDQAVQGKEGVIQGRVGWLQGLIPMLKNRPKYQGVANAELTSDQADAVATLGRSLADTMHPGEGPGDVITATTAPPDTTWAGQALTKAFQAAVAEDAAVAAYDLIKPDGDNWLAAMNDEKNTVWGRIQDLVRVKDQAPYAQWRPDILSELGDDSNLYGSIVSTIAAGFASAQGSTGSADGGDSEHVQDVIDAANTLMSQINVASASDRESLQLLTSFLASQAPSFETGASYVGRTGLAKIHQGEMITPRGDVRQGDAGGHFTLHGTDDLTRAIAAAVTPGVSYAQGQSARRRARERRR